MNRIPIIITIILLLTFPSYGQVKKLDSLYNKMFFNIFIHKPDSSVYDFVEKYFPSLAEKPDTSSWTIYPPGEFNEPQKTEHNLIFYKHPFFDFKFKEGKLELFSSESKDYLPRIRQASISFSFSNKLDADKALNYFVSIFDSASKNKIVKNSKGRKIISYSSGEKYTPELIFVLLKDELFENSYKLLFGMNSILSSD